MAFDSYQLIIYKLFRLDSGAMSCRLHIQNAISCFQYSRWHKTELYWNGYYDEACRSLRRSLQQ